MLQWMNMVLEILVKILSYAMADRGDVGKEDRNAGRALD